METPTTAPVHDYRTAERRSLALALLRTLPRDEFQDIRDILTDWEIELAHEVGLDFDTAYDDQNLLKVLVWDRNEDRNANTVLAEVQEIPEVAEPLLSMLKFATIDVLAERPGNWSERTQRLINAFSTVFPGIDIEGWVADIASDNAHEIELGLGPSGSPTS